ncbi:MAG: hypothetical protein K8L97_20195 [Anaerolineae bacterium]|nr:hypothetical protein [Anaerolineae bacterium]
MAIVHTAFGKVFLVKLNHLEFVSGSSSDLNERRSIWLKWTRERGLISLLVAFGILVCGIMYEKLDSTWILALGILGVLDMLLYLPDFVDYLLVKNGQLLKGEITQISGKLEMPGWFDLYLECQFTTPRGKVAKGHAMANRLDLQDKPMPQIGTSVAVLYVNTLLYRVM